MEKSKEGEEGLRPHTMTIPSTSISRKLAHTSSVYDLPVELLSCIFEFGHGSSEDEDDRDHRSGSRYWDGIDFHPIEDSETAHAQAPANKCGAPSFRMTVLLVCRHWYRMAITTPSLWTTLHLASWDSFEVLQMMLARSRGLPLYVDVCHYIEAYRMDSEDETGRPRPHLEQRYITLFRSLAPRFRRLRLRKSRINWSEPWISSMSNLTTLELKNADESVRPSWSELRSAPSLKRLVLCDAGPWDEESNTNSGPENPDIPVHLLNLTDLVLASYETPASLTALLQRLYIPALKSLSLDLSSPMEDFNILIEQLAGPATLPATGPTTGEQYTLLNQLEHLYILSLSWRNNIAALGMLYDGLHNLKSLQICLSDSWNATPRYFELLYLLFPQTIFGQGTLTVRLPRLETLIVYRHFGTIAPIRDVVEKRKAAGFPLKSLYIQNPDREDMRWLGENIETFTMF